jgi:hypothetical protein
VGGSRHRQDGSRKGEGDKCAPGVVHAG